MIFWPLIHTKFHNSLKIKPLQKPMWRRPDDKRNRRNPVNPYQITTVRPTLNRGDACNKTLNREDAQQKTGNPCQSKIFIYLCNVV